MSPIVAIYAAGLAAGCALATWRGRRGLLQLLLLVAAASALIWLVWGAAALRVVAIGAVAVALAAAASWAFRALLILVAPRRLGPALRAAPLTAAFGMLVILIYAAAGILAPVIAPHGEAEVIASAFAPADASMILGADQLGRDLFSRLIYGARNTVGLALLATTLAFLAGTAAGLLAATKGGWLDQLLGRVADVVMSVPSLVFALLILSILGTNLTIIVIVVAVIYAPRVFRLTRAVAGGVVAMDYIEAARLRGEGDWYLIRREVLPNATAPLIAEFGLEFCFVFLLISGLSFLGLGIQPPTADWGSMVRESATMISFGVVTPLIPAAAIALLTVAVNFVVDWMLFRASGLKG